MAMEEPTMPWSTTRAVKCDGCGSSCGRLWWCSCRVVCCVLVVLFWSCVVLFLLCVCYLFLLHK